MIGTIVSIMYFGSLAWHYVDTLYPRLPGYAALAVFSAIIIHLALTVQPDDDWR